ncbi:restriction endonuclease [Nitrosomonas sp.]|uniref:restriction endonuclease n=1 Tax=Nitrosomonas sp. TaxID=42353 RepID=UPI0025F36A40|nr:restriction endonuclease [Nitrosomonas sp.]MBY0484025.1 restriction endonuclease [Nitrosomonas sp.]
MSTKLSDDYLENQIISLQKHIEEWAKKHDLWYDCGFTSWIERYDDEPYESPCVLIFCFEGPLYNVFNLGVDELVEEFDALIESNTKFFYEIEDHVTMSFWVKDDEISLNAAFKDFFEWKWIAGLIQEDHGDIYEEIYSRIDRSPLDLHKFSSRQFEQFLDSVFKNNGYSSLLGPGQGDGGIDLRLYSEDAVGEFVTLVQAKRYASKNPIRLEAVQALSAVVEDEKANRGLFVTTSRYLPGVKKFAKRQNKKIILADSDNIVEWSRIASQKIIRDKSNLVSNSYIQDVLNGKCGQGLEGKIFCAHKGYNIHYHSFAIVLKEGRNAVLAMSLPTMVFSDDGYGQIGTHIPDTKFSNSSSSYVIFRAKKKKSQSEINLWGQRELYSLWDGKPTPFNYMD